MEVDKAGLKFSPRAPTPQPVEKVEHPETPILETFNPPTNVPDRPAPVETYDARGLRRGGPSGRLEESDTHFRYRIFKPSAGQLDVRVEADRLITEWRRHDEVTEREDSREYSRRGDEVRREIIQLPHPVREKLVRRWENEREILISVPKA